MWVDGGSTKTSGIASGYLKSAGERSRAAIAFQPADVLADLDFKICGDLFAAIE